MLVVTELVCKNGRSSGLEIFGITCFATFKVQSFWDVCASNDVTMQFMTSRYDVVFSAVIAVCSCVRADRLARFRGCGDRGFPAQRAG